MCVCVASHLQDNGTVWASVLVKCCGGCRSLGMTTRNLSQPVSVGYHKNPVVGAVEVAGKWEDMSLNPRNHINTEHCGGYLESPH